MRFATDVFRSVRTRARRGIWIEGLAALAMVAAVWAVVSFVIDRGLHLETSFRAVVLALGGIAALRTVVRSLMRPLSVRLDDTEVALAIERGHRGLGQSLISAVEFERDLDRSALRGQSQALMQRVVADATQGIGSLQLDRAFDRGRMRRNLRRLAGVVLAASALSVAFPSTVGLWFQRNLLLSDVEWPRATHLAFEGLPADGVLRVAERDDVTLRVRAEGEIPEQIELDVRFASGDRSLRAMDRTEDGMFTAVLPSLLEEARVVARGGDGETGPLRITIVPRPRITSLQVLLTPPSYIAKEETALEAVAGELRVPRGSKLRILGSTSKPLRTARLVRDAEHRFDGAVDAAGTSFEITFVPEQGGAFALEAIDRDDLGPAQPTQMFVRVLEDTPPQVDFQTRGIGSMITADARLPGVLRLRDDHGLGGVKAQSRATDATAREGGEKAPEVPFAPIAVDWRTPLQTGATDAELELVWDLQPLMKEADSGSMRNPIHPEMLLSIRFDATDLREPENQETRSEVRTLRVVTHEKMLQELRRRQGEQRRELGRVRQKVVEARAEVAEILSPTAKHDDAPKARLRVDQLARQQSSLAKTAQLIADRYRDILDEMVNNRLFEPNVVHGIEAKVVSPLVTVALEDFPDSGRLLAAFAADGTEDSRSAGVEALVQLIARLDRILEQMDRTEDLAAIVESLRVVIRSQADAENLIQRLRDAQGAGIFGRDKEEEKRK